MRAIKGLQKIQTELGIKHTNYHSLRASCITYLLLDGMSVVKVQVLVGHAELSTIQRYIRLSGSDLSGVTDNLSIKTERSGRLIQFNKSKE